MKSLQVTLVNVTLYLSSFFVTRYLGFQNDSLIVTYNLLVSTFVGYCILVFHCEMCLTFSFNKRRDYAITLIKPVLMFLVCVAIGFFRKGNGISEKSSVLLHRGVVCIALKVLFTEFSKVLCHLCVIEFATIKALVACVINCSFWWSM